MMRSGNPALRLGAFSSVRVSGSGRAMSIEGTVNKTLFLLFIAVFSASWVWGSAARFQPFVSLIGITGFIIGFVTIFKKEWSPVTSPIYAFVEGMFLGTVSAMLEKSYPGIVIQAVALTFGTLFCLLLAYKSRLIQVTQNFRLGVVSATGAIVLIYIVSMVMGFFGTTIPFIHEGGLIGIGFSLFVVVIAALNLVLDFDLIEKGAEYGAPRYMEWFGAFALIVTLVWLYVEILRLLAKTRRR